MAVQIPSVFRQYCFDTAEKHGCTIVEMIVRGTDQRPVIEIYLDSRDGVTLEHCTDISRELQEYADTTNVIESNYRLDVSSPGADRPLQFLWQYPKHIQRTLHIKTTHDEQYDAILLGVDEEQSVIHLKMIPAKKSKADAHDLAKTLPFAEIKEATIIITLS